MGQYMPSDGFFGINMSHGVSRVSHYLIGHENSNVELLGQFQESAQDFSQDLLPFSELSSSSVIRPENSHDGINDQERVRAFHHKTCCVVEKCD